jgi:hypothetical protein
MITRFRFEQSMTHLRRSLLTAAGVSLFAVAGTSAGCQDRNKIPLGAARVLFDSLIAAHEATYDSVTANLGYDRMNCLTERAATVLDFDAVHDVNRKAETLVRTRHSSAERRAGLRGIGSIHPVGDSAFCRRVDSLWYELVAHRIRTHAVPPKRPPVDSP